MPPLAALLLVVPADRVRAAAAPPADDLASHFTTAPDTLPDQKQLVDIVVNGVDFGTQLIVVSNGRPSLPPQTAAALHIDAPPGKPLDLSPSSGIVAVLDEAGATLALTVPSSRLAAQAFAPDTPGTLHLSPETWGVYADYDLDLRQPLGGGGGAHEAGSASLAGFGGGGLVDLRTLAPDVAGSFGWAYDSAATGGDGLVRLDSTISWRPSRLDLSVSGGDIVSSTPASLAAGRPYRFAGFAAGTDHSATPDWSSSPIPTVMGTAQARSAVDVYLDGQRTFHTETAGGAFSLVLPPGSTGVGTNVVVTDVTGRDVVIPVTVPLVDAQLIRRGVLLWSAGIGAPRFGYGTGQTSYEDVPYGYGNVRWGALQSVTTAAHAEAGPGLVETEAGADAALSPRLAVHGLLAGSHSAHGSGVSGRAGIVASLPFDLSLQAAASRTTTGFDDVVSVSGRAYARARGIDPTFSVPTTRELSGTLSWQPLPRLAVAASAQSDSYQNSPAVGFASLDVTYQLGRLPLFANLVHAMGGQRSTSIVAGVSFSFGGVQASVSGGYGTGDGSAAAMGDRGPSGNVTASHPLGQAVDDVGWDVYANRSPTGTFSNADAQIRTGAGIAGAAVQALGSGVTGLATLRGSAGVVDLHPFVSDPASGGLIVADAGRPGVPVAIDGYDRGRTGWDGKLAIPDAIPGVPQRIAIDPARLPLDAVPTDTDQIVVVRDGAATVASFGVRSAASAALLRIVRHGQPPPVGSTVVSSTASAPISKEGRAYLPSFTPGEVLRVEMPDGTACLVPTPSRGSSPSRGGGHGGGHDHQHDDVGRRLGVLACQDTR